MSSRAGIVLAGGFARRFGDRDKTLAELSGKPLIAHAVQSLRPIVDRVIVSCRHEQRQSFERVLSSVTYRPDPTPDEGPLAGLDAALDGLDATAVAVSTADRPLVPTDLYRHLFDARSAEAIVIRADGIDQPVPAIFDVPTLRTTVSDKRANGTRRLRAVLAGIEYTTVPAAMVTRRWGEHVLADINTPAQLDRLNQSQ